MVNIKVEKINDKKKSKSRIKAFFNKFINNALDQFKVQLEIKSNEEFLKTINEILTNDIISLELEQNEIEEFQTVTKRNYHRYNDMTTLNVDGSFSTKRYNAQLLAEVLNEHGIELPIRVYIQSSNGKIEFTFFRPIIE